MGKRRFCILWVMVALALAWLSPVYGAFLSDRQLYFDPASVDFDYYERIGLADLATANSHQWEAGTDPVIDADILPVLKPGTYTNSYGFSQSDYYLTPNVDYKADLSSGTLTGYFFVSGQYLVRVTRQSGDEQVFTVFAETGLLELPDDSDKTGPSKKISGPSGDLILVATGDDVVDQAAENITDEGKNVQRTTGVSQTIDKIKAASQAAGKKLHVELVGHGAPGRISMDDKQVDDGNLIGPDAADIEAFQQAIDDYVNHLSLFSCRSAEGTAGDTLLETLAKSIGVASGWTVPITVEDGYFNVDYRKDATMALMPEASVDLPLADIPPGMDLCLAPWNDTDLGIELSASEAGNPSSCSAMVEDGQIWLFPGVLQVDMSNAEGLSGKTVQAAVTVFNEVMTPENILISLQKKDTVKAEVQGSGASQETLYLVAQDVDRLLITFQEGGGVSGIQLSNVPGGESLAFYQMDFRFDDTVYTDTDWGGVDFTFPGRESLMYFNLSVNGSWQVRNLPVFSREGTAVTQTLRCYFDLGISEFGAVPDIRYGYTFTPELQQTMPESRYPATVADDQIRLLAGFNGGLMPVLGDARPFIGGRVSSQQSHAHQRFPNQEAGEKECAPTAVSNSLKFLNETHNLGLSEDQTAIETMKAAVGFEAGWGAPLDSWWETKASYMKEHNYPITTRKITDMSQLADEIDRGQDLEIQESWTDAEGIRTGHTSALVGITRLEDGRYVLDIADDRKQGEKGGTHVTPYTYNPETGEIDDAGFTSTFEYAVVECPAHPGDYNLDGQVGVADAIGLMRAISQGESQTLGRGDANGDGVLDLSDLIAVLGIVVGL